jgi:hypothetical protein
LNGRASQLAMAAVSKTAERRALRVQLPLLPLRALGRVAKVLVFQTRQVGSIPKGHSRASANRYATWVLIGRRGFERFLPEPWATRPCRNHHRFRGRLTGRTSGSEPADVGSTPAPGASVLVEQPGVLATLSRWRSRVRIPPGTLAGTVRKPAKRPSSNLGDRLWVRFPPVLLTVHAPAGHWRA